MQFFILVVDNNKNFNISIVQMQDHEDTGTTKQKFVKHPQLNHFLLYSFSFCTFGAIMGSLGPLFPYLASNQNRKQTQYSSLIVSKALGFIIGSVLANLIGQRLLLHHIIMIGLIGLGVFGSIFSIINSIYAMCISIFLCSIGNSLASIGINLAALHAFKGKYLTTFLQLIHASYGIGSLLAPFLVYLIQIDTVKILGIIILFSSPLYYLLDTPEELLFQSTSNEAEIETDRQLPNYSVFFLSFSFLIVVGEQVGFGNWVSSFSVMQEFSSKQHATIYNSTYWTSMTIFRMIVALFTGPPTIKIKILTCLGIFSTIFGYYIIYYANSEIGLILLSVLYGLSFSVVFPLLLTIPQEYGYKLSIEHGSLMMICGSIGEGGIAAGIGKLMEWLGNNWFLYSLFGLNIFAFMGTTINKHLLDEEKRIKSQKNEIQQRNNL